MMRDGAALVTGGAQRVGADLVRTLARRGLDIAIHCHASRDAADALADELRGFSVKAAVVPANLLDRVETRDLLPAAAAALGRPITVLVNNASIFEHDTIQTATWESWDRHIGSNLRAPFELIQAFAAQTPRGARDAEGEPVASGCIINMIDQRVRKLTPALPGTFEQTPAGQAPAAIGATGEAAPSAPADAQQ
jgi:NAD(P)-dependent dehydrogenase (short-subunit alcohol dehydrogenase family)